MMDTRKKIIIAALGLPLFLASCGKEEVAQVQPAKQAPQAKSAASGAVEAVAPISATAEPPRRNPFQSHIILMKGAESGAKKIVKGPLECCELSLFRLVAVVSSTDNAFALVLAPDSKRYVVRKGDKIGTNDGRVVKIGKNTVTVREPNRDEKGNMISTTDTELMLQTEKAGERTQGRK